MSSSRARGGILVLRSSSGFIFSKIYSELLSLSYEIRMEPFYTQGAMLFIHEPFDTNCVEVMFSIILRLALRLPRTSKEHSF